MPGLERNNPKEAFEVASCYEAFYTGGNVIWKDEVLYCQKDSIISLLNTEDGSVRFIGKDDKEDTDVINTFTTDGTRIITSHRSSLFKIWNQNGEVEKTWKSYHLGPVACLVLDESKLASGGADGNVRIWDLEHQTCVLCLRGCQGVVSCVQFMDEQTLLASGDDGKIHCFDLQTGSIRLTYESHFSKVTAIVKPHKEGYFVSLGRDKVIILWKIESKEPLKVIPTFEAIATIVGLPMKFKVPDFKSDPEKIYVAAAGENGVVRIWDVFHAKEIYVQQNSLVSKSKEEGELSVTDLLINPKQKAIALITANHDIIIHHLKSFVCLKQFIGYLDQIFDAVFFGEGDTHLAVASNSGDIKVFENETMNCQLLKGHEDIVVALSTSKANPNLLVSASKDHKVRLWLMKDSVTCVGIGSRHTDVVGSVCFSNQSTNFAVSVSKDNCVKIWNIPTTFEENSILTCVSTEVAHDKEINSVTVSQNDRIIATASLDKTVKLWTDSLTLIGVLRGHKKGVWCVKFSPVDQIVATSSADCTIKLWSVTSLNCLKTIEGHEARVLNIEFLSNGFQLISTSGDGLIKLFDIKTSECKLTLNHSEENQDIWALAVSSNENFFITGGSDSRLLKWRDITEEKQVERLREEQELIKQEQKLSNYIQNKQYLKALKYALRLDKPNQVLNIIKTVMKIGDQGLNDTIKELDGLQKEKLFKTASLWNTNSKNSHIAQLIIGILVTDIQSGVFKPSGLGGFIEETLPYTERHFRRVTNLLQDLYFLDYTVHCMQPHAKSC